MRPWLHVCAHGIGRDLARVSNPVLAAVTLPAQVILLSQLTPLLAATKSQSASGTLEPTTPILPCTLLRTHNPLSLPLPR